MRHLIVYSNIRGNGVQMRHLVFWRGFAVQSILSYLYMKKTLPRPPIDEGVKGLVYSQPLLWMPQREL